MEFPLLSVPLFFTLLLFILMLTKSRNESKSRNSSKLPPGPRKLPIIGNLHQMAGPLPHQTLRRLSNIHGPLMHLQLGEVSTVVVSSPEMAIEIMKKHDATFASRPRLLLADVMSHDYTNIAFAPYGPYWREMRKICTTELLTTGRVKSFRYAREKEVSDLITSISLCVGEPVNLTPRVFSLTGGIISRVAFGKSLREKDKFLSITQELVELAGGFAVADLYPSIPLLQVITGMKRKLENLHKRTDKLLGNIIDEHKRMRARTSIGDEAPELLLDVLLKYTDEANTKFPITIDNVKSVLVDIFSAGSDTASVTVDWAMAELMKNPSMMSKAQAEVRQVFRTKGRVDEANFHELHYLKLVIKEVLRLHIPLPLLLPRECGEKCEINGYEIPEKTKVVINAWALGRDPKYWNDPDTFNPERFKDSLTDYKGNSFEYLPFGAGRRICPGISFGMANVELILAELLYHFDWKLPDGIKCEELDMTDVFAAAVKRKHNLVLIPSTYSA